MQLKTQRKKLRQNFKRCAAFFMAFIMVLTGAVMVIPQIPEAAYAVQTPNAESDFITRTIPSDGTVAIAGYKGTGTKVVIPNKIDGKTVESIDDSAFENNTKIESVVIPESVILIGDGAFTGCTSLKSVTLKGSETAVGYDGADFVFDSDSEIIFYCPASAISAYRELMDPYGESSWTFAKDTSEPIGGTESGSGGGESGNTEPDKNVKFTVDANGVLTEVVIPAGTNGKIKIPEKVNGITVKTIDTYAFKGKTNVKEVTIPATVEKINSKDIDEGEGSVYRDSAFEGCQNLTKLTFLGNAPKGDKLGSVGSGIFGMMAKAANDPQQVEIVVSSKYETAYRTLFSGYLGMSNKQVTLTVTGTDPDETAEPETKPEFVFSVTSASAKTAQVTGYRGAGGDIVIPSEYTADGETYTVTAVKDSALSNYGTTSDKASMAAITSVRFPETVTTIGNDAFRNLPKLKSVDFGGVKEIGLRAFSGCSKLSSIDLKVVEKIGGVAFNACALTEVKIPATVTEIGYKAFNGNSKLEKAVFEGTNPPTMKYDSSYTGDYPFYNYSKKPEVVCYVPDEAFDAYSTASSWAAMIKKNPYVSVAKVSSIGGGSGEGEKVFGGFDATKKEFTYEVEKGRSYTLTILDGQKGEAAIKKCNFSYKGKLEIPGEASFVYNGDGKTYWFHVVEIEGSNAGGAFAEYNPDKYTGAPYGFTEIVIPDTVRKIGEQAFIGCKKMETITFGNGVTAIDNRAFSGCESLKNINISASVETIGESVFSGADSLQAINVDKGNKNYASIDGVLFDKAKETLIKYPVAREGTEYDIPEGTKVIDTQAFMVSASNRSASKLEKVTFPETLKEIKDQAFQQTSLKEVTIPANVEFGKNIFMDATSLTKVTFDKDVKKLGEYMFWSCDNLNIIHGLEDSAIESIAKEAFSYTDLSNGITLPKNLKKIESYAFYRTNLPKIVIPDSVTEMGTGVFMNSQKLDEAVFGTGMTYVAPYTFFYCDELSKVTLTDNITELKDGCFAANGLNGHAASDYNAEGLTTIELPNSITKLGSYVFADNKDMTSIVLPDSITEMGDATFRGSEALESVSMPGSLAKLGDCTFEHCISLTKAEFKEGMSLRRLPADTFFRCVKLEYLYLPESVQETDGTAFAYATGLDNVDVANYEIDMEQSDFELYDMDFDDTQADGTPLYEDVEIIEEKDDTFGLPVYKATINLSPDQMTSDYTGEASSLISDAQKDLDQKQDGDTLETASVTSKEALCGCGGYGGKVAVTIKATTKPNFKYNVAKSNQSTSGGSGSYYNGGSRYGGYAATGDDSTAIIMIAALLMLLSGTYIFSRRQRIK